MGVSINGGTPKWFMLNGKSHPISKWMTGGMPMTKRTPPCGCLLPSVATCCHVHGFPRSSDPPVIYDFTDLQHGDDAVSTAEPASD